MHLFFDLNPDLKSSIFLGGVGRSGTTWVSDVINARNDYRLMFEPFYPEKVPLCRPFRYRQYLRPTDSNTTYLTVGQTILSGKIRNAWIDKYNRCLIARKRLVKDIRANLMLKWMHVHFPAIRIVVLLRHPCAVASSKLKSGWGTHLDEFLDQPELMLDYLTPFEEVIKSAETDFEKHIVLWCVENYVPLKQFASGEAYFTLYERLCLAPEEEYKRLFEFLGLTLTSEHRAAFKRPSVMSRSVSAIVKGDSLIDAWRKDVTQDQVKRATQIVAAFGLSEIYSDASLPQTDPNVHLGTR